MARDHPAELAGLRRAERELAGARGLIPGVLERVHGGEDAALVGVGEALEQLADLGLGALVELLERLGTFVGQLDVLAAAVVLGPLAGHESAGLEAREQAAQVAGVEVERRAQVGDRGHVALAQLVQHARLRQRVGGAEQPVPEHAEPLGVEAVERPDRGDARRRGR